PMHVFDDHQQRTLLCGDFDQLCERERAAALTCLRIHRLLECAELRRQRRFDQITQEHDLIDTRAQASRESLYRCGTFFRRCVFREAAEAERERRDRPLATSLTEI